MTTPEPDLDLGALRARLSSGDGHVYWRSLDELARTPEFEEMLGREFPAGASEWARGVNRRDFLTMAAASLALAGLAGCTKRPTQAILPYVRQPEEVLPGEPLFYASAMVLGGYATGVLVKSREGHPIKVEGNPKHPASLGGSNIWMQASILDLYDPDRSQTVTHRGQISSWAEFLSALNQIATQQASTGGAGLRVLTETVTSPTVAAQIRDVLKRYPKAKWIAYEGVNRDYVQEGARLAFGRVVETQCRFDRAAVIVALDSDFLSSHPDRLRYCKQFTDGRRVSAGGNSFNRLYVAEPTPTVTGSMADERLPVRSADVESLARALRAQLNGNPVDLSEAQRAWCASASRDLQANRGKGVVIAGECQPPTVHALVHRLNERLGNVGQTLYYTEPAELGPAPQLTSLQDLVRDMQRGQVDTFFILGSNPVYLAPADLQFAQALGQVNTSVHLGLHQDETAACCTWHIPQTHYLESWGDARAFDGTVTVIQPLISPLYAGKSACELLGALGQQQPVRSDYDLVREFWRSQERWPDFEQGWRRALHEGLVADTALAPLQVSLREEASPEQAKPAEGLELNFRPDPSLWDGRFANNGWLQECPKPLTKLTWDNALMISPGFAQQHAIAVGDIIHLEVGGRELLAPAWILPGQAENALTLHLGFGRERAGRIGHGVGVDANRLRTAEAFWAVHGVSVRKTGRQHALVATQTHHNVHSPERQIYRSGSWRQFQADPGFVRKSVELPGEQETLYNPGEYPANGYKWGMSIDLNTCIGCNACLVACEVENNIPVVGKDQVSRNREMFWIRVDTYYRGSLENPRFHHMPVPCMHCEHAPCELVCPTAATVHDHEGLNLQVYNRCVGTRFCSNNCPYKVRRFNFLQYADYHSPSLEPMFNPDVTVRWRGVMEKCTYCLQRIAAARIRAEKDNRLIQEGEVRTACQQACPTEAIVFGDLNNPNSRVRKLKSHPLDYAMLGELNTRPRTTYLARLENPAPGTA
jgi:MoCo/4Fe-4S cofactor protein with predicted Tat translocation signal